MGRRINAYTLLIVVLMIMLIGIMIVIWAIPVCIIVYKETIIMKLVMSVVLVMCELECFMIIKREETLK
jgi:heme A synthase